MLRPASAALLLTLSLIGCADDRRAERLKAAGPNPTLEKLMTVADAKAGARLFGTCAACHTSSAGGPDTGGPNLHGIYGQPIGQHSARFGYTAALRAKGGVWDDKALDAWIANPQRFVPGTKMQFSGIPDPLARADLIAYLRSLSD
ncbi:MULTISPECIES: c-type cytochrome [Sphingobium]|uniref:Cytochrome c domain-containing protein n=1 Tax=Sphingobium yanoikuyae ATCC 51230 TaxID=883163 RepID=K9DAF2_SPHYA|nr:MULTISPECIES: c-type cytochrome [Sphingobium]EKU74480.1 hypothetical protein HMPREF9718_02008 [Sphingobium yanoikuyae ATCC 51230]WIA57180.1 c-type cytochrome [Sphingobium sp. WTD-1]WQE06411.1 c-type cytochrome [Sphingobium yanoikuyae]SHM62246.1 cytochrome c [Sphingobium sp. YR657]